jgi:hypothetical protein
MGVFLAAGPSCTITELTRLIGFGRLSGEHGEKNAAPLLIAHLNTHGAVEVPRTHPGHATQR